MGLYGRRSVAAPLPNTEARCTKRGGHGGPPLYKLSWL